MKITIDVSFKEKNFTDSEKRITKEIFGLVIEDVYFNLNMRIDTKDHKFNNFSGISGSGKTIIKNKIKEQLIQNQAKIIDYDDVQIDGNKTVLELMNISNGSDEILKILSGFGLFEMRLLFSKYNKLSQGQQKRVKYAYMFKNLDGNVTHHLLIDEFLTFVDSVSSITFAASVRKFLNDKNVKLYTFGVNDSIVGQFEDITFILGNSCLSAIVENNEITYVSSKQDTDVLEENWC